MAAHAERVVVYIAFVTHVCTDIADLFHSSVCSRDNGCSPYHQMRCERESSMIAIRNAHYAYKLKSSRCRKNLPCNKSATENCCNVNTATDCLGSYGEDRVKVIIEACSQKTQCKVQGQWFDRLPENCSGHHYSISSSSLISYMCIREFQIILLGENKAVKGQSVYVLYGTPSIVNKQYTCYIASATDGTPVTINAVDVRCPENHRTCYQLNFSREAQTWTDKAPLRSFQVIREVLTPFTMSVNFTALPPLMFWSGFEADTNIAGIVGGVVTTIIVLTVLAVIMASLAYRRKLCHKDQSKAKKGDKLACEAVPTTSYSVKVTPPDGLPEDNDDHNYCDIHETDLEKMRDSTPSAVFENGVLVFEERHGRGKSEKTGYDHVHFNKQENVGPVGCDYGRLGVEGDCEYNHLGQEVRSITISNDYDTTVSA